MEHVLYYLCIATCIGTVVAFLFNRLQPGSRVWTISISVTVLLLVLVSITAWIGWGAAQEQLYRSFSLLVMNIFPLWYERIEGNNRKTIVWSLTLALVVVLFGTILG
ncbi:hypothetical protein QK289_08815 [Exiguobacterium antarcticum]|uniref:Uncharacterized protein n=1 Tax=Exiguobacterium antarcticum TaxID=132920 RepID=A0ABT6R2D5_9BACL|nr:hypothetical protein [Exiguobacterium antarcticum]MDI3235104.1 hypothetical protein [Exiguobacterium antarcticum]